MSIGTITRDFMLATNPLRLGEIVITGAGTSSAAEKLGNVRNHMDSTMITRSNESNVVESLAGKAPNVEVTEASGEPFGHEIPGRFYYGSGEEATNANTPSSAEQLQHGGDAKPVGSCRRASRYCAVSTTTAVP